jgi:hypothetical protein
LFHLSTGNTQNETQTGEKMIQVDYPKATTQLNLSGIFSIEADDQFDTIFLGDKNSQVCLGYIGYINGQYLFKPYDTEHEFEPKATYQDCLLDVFIFIANDPDHAQEFAVRSLRKVLDSDYEVV